MVTTVRHKLMASPTLDQLRRPGFETPPKMMALAKDYKKAMVNVAADLPTRVISRIQS
jgi:hypothetical protein